MRNKKFVLLAALLSAAFFSSCSRQQYNDESDFEFKLSEKGDLFITSYVGEKKEVRIPSRIQKKPVIGIGEAAFADKELVSVTIPNSVTSIGALVFSGCTSLTSVTFEGTITSENFSGYNALPGDLRDKYLAGGIGTYTRASGGEVWEKQ